MLEKVAENAEALPLVEAYLAVLEARRVRRGESQNEPIRECIAVIERARSTIR